LAISFWRVGFEAARVTNPPTPPTTNSELAAILVVSDVKRDILVCMISIE
jgi:hypothetical protein